MRFFAAIQQFMAGNAVKIAGIALSAIAVAAVLFQAKNAGKAAEQLEQLKLEYNNATIRNDIEIRNRALGGDADAIRERLRRQRKKIR